MYKKEQVQLTWSRANIFLFEIEWAALDLAAPCVQTEQEMKSPLFRSHMTQNSIDKCLPAIFISSVSELCRK